MLFLHFVLKATKHNTFLRNQFQYRKHGLVPAPDQKRDRVSTTEKSFGKFIFLLFFYFCAH